MKKTSIVMLLILLSVVLVSGSAYAISGVCSNCHTMHNSQSGLGEVRTYNGLGGFNTGVTTPQQYLLKADCIACHTGTTGQTTAGAPIVLHITAPSGQGAGYTNAGGDFYWVAKGLGATNSKGHNVAGLADQEAAPMNAPPGFDSTATSGFAFGTVGTTWTNQLTCAGTYGCHGRHDATGIKGAHHGNTGLTSNQCNVANTVGNSYRFLGGIKGLENVDWNWNETALTHNEYYGANSPANRDQANTTYVNKETISFSCAECHGYFHSRTDDTIGGTSPWLRHPTDINLPNKTEYATYNPDNANVYSVMAPVGRPTIPASSGQTVAPDGAGDTGAIVTCLSCHRAHGSPEPDLLRWTYSGMVAGAGGPHTGCFICHTTKN